MSYIRLFNHYIHTPYLILGCVELIVLMLSVHIGALICFPEITELVIEVSSPLFVQSLVFGLALMACTLAIGVYQSKLTEGHIGVLIRTIVSYCLLGASFLTVFYYLIPSLFLGRGVLSVSILVAYVLVFPVRVLFFWLVDVDALKRRVLVLGTGKSAEKLASMIQAEGDVASFSIMGYVKAGDESPSIPDEHILADCGDLAQCAKDHRVNEIVVALDERRKTEGGRFPVDSLLDAKLEGVEITESIAFFERETGKIELSMVNPSWFVFSKGFSFSQSRDMLKRAFDLTVCMVLLIFALPFMLLTALLVFAEDGAPVLFKQTRVGINGKKFTLYKFRSMRKDAEKDGAVWAKQNDDRITRIGNFIRNTRLDELPQIYNVVKGDMSFVGPRPERPEFVDGVCQGIPFYNERHRVKPGLMGWAQLKYPYGASVEDAENKLKYDLYYTKNHSFMLDLLIVVQTVEVVLLGKGVR
ncbi:hypothetical protein A9Q99_20110 [Gammaproteobacteria bacterium 45_16_T64]|nr:hypothetical protein A9Q99_20110 [Gammaproteobacteria bacterium 45_16_T64]